MFICDSDRNNIKSIFLGYEGRGLYKPLPFICRNYILYIENSYVRI